MTAEDLYRSLLNPHPETRQTVELGFDEWAQRLPDEPVIDLVDPSSGTEVRWIPGEGWREVEGGLIPRA